MVNGIQMMLSKVCLR